MHSDYNKNTVQIERTGGAFLLDTSHASRPPLFGPESIVREDRNRAAGIIGFTRNENIVEAHNAEPDRSVRDMLRAAGNLQLLGPAHQEPDVATQLSCTQICLVEEGSGALTAFSLACGAHIASAVVPILRFGTLNQRLKWLPQLTSGRVIGAFPRLEQGGSPDISVRAKPFSYTEKSGYLLNSPELQLRLDAHAELFLVLAMVEGSHLTAFLVERETPGVTIRTCEPPGGVNVTSVAVIHLDDVFVPEENVLGKIGEGDRVESVCVNIGKLSIAATALGICKEVIRFATQSAQHATPSSQPAGFRAVIDQKLTHMTTRTLGLESLLYDTAGSIDSVEAASLALQPGEFDGKWTGIDEFAIECTILEIIASETVKHVLDRAIEIVHSTTASGDNHIFNPIFKHALYGAQQFLFICGSSEGNRLRLVNELLKRDIDGRLPLTETIDRLFDRSGKHHVPIYDEMMELNRSDNESPPEMKILEQVQDLVQYLRLTTIGAIAAARSLGDERLTTDIEISLTIGKMVSNVSVMDCLYRRCRQSGSSAPGLIDASEVFGYHTGMVSWERLQSVLAHRWNGDDMEHHIHIWRSVFDAPIWDSIPAARRVADLVVKSGGYPW